MAACRLLRFASKASAAESFLSRCGSRRRAPEWRGLATNLHRLGAPAETIQAILRHSNVAVTQACYIKTVRDDAKAAMEKLETALMTPR